MREPGFYWVRSAGKEIVAEWALGLWMLSGLQMNQDIEVLSERLQPPGEAHQPAPRGLYTFRGLR